MGKDKSTTDAQAHAYRRLAAAVIWRAALDAKSGNGHAVEARRWLVSSPWCTDLLAWVAPDLAVNVAAWVGDLPEVAQSALEL